MRYEIVRADRAATAVAVGEICYRGADYYGCASDDTDRTGIEHISLSRKESGEPFFTIPFDDVRLLREDSSNG